MAETRRKLTTIFSADVQDYTRLMGADEEGTLATLKHYRDAMARLIEAHDGRVINTWGDGLIAEFASVVEAVRAAVDVQNELAGLNAARPADGRMLFRIGINLGDVIVEGDDIYGDGVNIAARLQSSATAGGIVISSTVYDQVRNKVAVGFDFLGPLTVKNVEEGVPSYAVRIGEVEDGTSPKQRREPRAPHMVSEGRAAPRSNAKRPEARTYVLSTVIIVGLIAINLMSWKGYFWAAWPVLAIVFAAGFRWLRGQQRFDPIVGSFTLAGLAVVCINILSWQGTFWAVWPLLAFGLAAAIRWRMLR
jgi:class 3 adenylate cyclase